MTNVIRVLRDTRAFLLKMEKLAADGDKRIIIREAADYLEDVIESLRYLDENN